MANRINIFLLWLLCHLVAGGIGVSISSAYMDTILAGNSNRIGFGLDPFSFFIAIILPLLTVTIGQWLLLSTWLGVRPKWIFATIASVAIFQISFPLLLHAPFMRFLIMFWFIATAPMVIFFGNALATTWEAGGSTAMAGLAIGMIIGIVQAVMLAQQARNNEFAPRRLILGGWVIVSAYSWSAIFLMFVYNHLVPTFPQPIMGMLTIGGLYGGSTGVLLLLFPIEPAPALKRLGKAVVAIGIPLMLFWIVFFAPYWQHRGQQILFARIQGPHPMSQTHDRAGIYITATGDVYVFQHRRQINHNPLSRDPYPPQSSYALFRKEFGFSGNYVMRIEPDVLAEMNRIAQANLSNRRCHTMKGRSIYAVYTYNQLTGRHTAHCHTSSDTNLPEPGNAFIEWLDSVNEQARLMEMP